MLLINTHLPKKMNLSGWLSMKEHSHSPSRNCLLLPVLNCILLHLSMLPMILPRKVFKVRFMMPISFRPDTDSGGWQMLAPAVKGYVGVAKEVNFGHFHNVSIQYGYFCAIRTLETGFRTLLGLYHSTLQVKCDAHDATCQVQHMALLAMWIQAIQGV